MTITSASLSARRPRPHRSTHAPHRNVPPAGSLPVFSKIHLAFLTDLPFRRAYLCQRPPVRTDWATHTLHTDKVLCDQGPNWFGQNRSRSDRHDERLSGRDGERRACYSAWCGLAVYRGIWGSSSHRIPRRRRQPRAFRPGSASFGSRQNRCIFLVCTIHRGAGRNCPAA